MRGAGRVAAQDRVADDEVVRFEDGPHELCAHGAAVHEGDVVRKGEVLLHPLDAAHADAFVGEQDVAHAENENALKLAQVRYEVGSGDLRGVQQQQLAAYGSQTALVRVQAERLVQRVNLYLALGGGFEAVPATAPVAQAKE